MLWIATRFALDLASDCVYWGLKKSVWLAWSATWATGSACYRKLNSTDKALAENAEIEQCLEVDQRQMATFGSFSTNNTQKSIEFEMQEGPPQSTKRRRYSI